MYLKAQRASLCFNGWTKLLSTMHESVIKAKTKKGGRKQEGIPI